jgi:hypothetical protein
MYENLINEVFSFDLKHEEGIQTKYLKEKKSSKRKNFFVTIFN